MPTISLLTYYHSTSYSARYTFSGKERDEETGYSITSLRSISPLRPCKSKQACFDSRPLRRFGARYYNSTYSIWMSVDPMSDKYPSLSPYAYCGNNPVKLVDPSGEDYEVVIVGDYVEKAFESLQSGTNLQLSIDENGKITASGTALNENDEQLLKAITSMDVTCEINTGLQFGAGEYHGTIYNAQDATSISTNNVNIFTMQDLELNGASGAGIIHEITEGYNLGRYVVDTRKSTIPTNASWGHMKRITVGVGEHAKESYEFVPNDSILYNIYLNEGHLKATKAPNEMRRKEAKSYKAATF